MWWYFDLRDDKSESEKRAMMELIKLLTDNHVQFNLVALKWCYRIRIKEIPQNLDYEIHKLYYSVF